MIPSILFDNKHNINTTILLSIFMLFINNFSYAQKQNEIKKAKPVNSTLEVRRATVRSVEDELVEKQNAKKIAIQNAKLDNALLEARKTINKLDDVEKIEERAFKVQNESTTKSTQEVQEILENIEEHKPHNIEQNMMELEMKENKKGKKSKIIIRCNGTTHFDAEKKIITLIKSSNYRDFVRVVHPQFDMICDKLVLTLDKESTESDIDKAVATGYVEIIKIAEDGEKAIAVSKRADYDAKTEILKLQGSPQIQKGRYWHKATKYSTIMILDANGQMRAKGPTRTTLIKGKDKGIKTKPRKKLK